MCFFPFPLSFVQQRSTSTLVFSLVLYLILMACARVILVYGIWHLFIMILGYSSLLWKLRNALNTLIRICCVAGMFLSVYRFW